MKSYLLKIRGGCDVDSQGNKAGKGPLVAEEISNTLGTSQDQYLFQSVGFMRSLGGVTALPEQLPTLQAANGMSGNNKPCVCYPFAFDGYNQSVTGDKTMTLRAGMYNCSSDTVPCVVSFEPGIAAREGGHIYESVSGTLRAKMGDNQMAVAYSVENHPADSRVNIDDSGKCQTLTSRMGTGGGNVPMVMCMATQQGNAEIMENKAPTITAMAGMSGNNQPVVCLEGNGSRPSHRGDGYKVADEMFTLNTTEVHAVCYEVEMEVAKRKYEVDIERLKELLRSHKTISNKEIAERLNQPLTLVEHWFRADKYFAIPQAEIWLKLKELLGIDTDEFDKQIMEYEFVAGNYDMRNRIWGGDTAPTLTQGCDDYLLVPKIYGICSYDSNAMRSANPSSGIYEAATSRTLDLNGGNPNCNQGGMVVIEPKYQGMILDDITPKHSTGDIAFTTRGTDYKRDGGLCVVMSYQKHTGPLMASGYEKNDTQEAMSDMYVVEPMYWDGSQIAGTLTANNAGGNQRMPDKNHFQCVLQPVASFYPQMKAESQCYREDGVANTLVNGTNPGFQNGVVVPK